MSDLLIRNIPAPTYDQIIVIARNEDGRLCARLNPSHDECHEVIELPPHGRLIDMDKLDEAIMNASTIQQGMRLYESAPTVIEADEVASTVIEKEKEDG